MTTSFPNRFDGALWMKVLASPHFLFSLAFASMLLIGLSQLEINDHKEQNNLHPAEQMK